MSNLKIGPFGKGRVHGNPVARRMSLGPGPYDAVLGGNTPKDAAVLGGIKGAKRKWEGAMKAINQANPSEQDYQDLEAAFQEVLQYGIKGIKSIGMSQTEAVHLQNVLRMRVEELQRKYNQPEGDEEIAQTYNRLTGGINELRQEVKRVELIFKSQELPLIFRRALEPYRNLLSNAWIDHQSRFKNLVNMHPLLAAHIAKLTREQLTREQLKREQEGSRTSQPLPPPPPLSQKADEVEQLKREQEGSRTSQPLSPPPPLSQKADEVQKDFFCNPNITQEEESTESQSSTHLQGSVQDHTSWKESCRRIRRRSSAG